MEMKAKDVCNEVLLLLPTNIARMLNEVEILWYI
jgi:hypothetical protein